MHNQDLLAFLRQRNKGISAALLIVLLLNLLLPGYALAWKPTTHVFLGDLALADALDDGFVSIYRVNYRTGEIVGVVGVYAVDPAILAALQSYPEKYRAGILGPDAYPDILTGQQAIHPSEEVSETPGGTQPWLDYLWRQLEDNDTSQNLAFVAGYLTHAAGDMYGHTFVNNFTGGEFTFEPPLGPANAIKHILLEGYVDKRMSGVVQPVDIGDDVDQFIYRTLVDARLGTELGDDLLRPGAAGTDYSIPRIYSTLRDALEIGIRDKRKAAAECKWFDPTCSALILNLTADYMAAWRDDIDEGLQAWPQVSHEVAVALFFNPERKADVAKADQVLTDYVTDHLISMSGQPDFVGGIIGALGDLSALIESIIPVDLFAPIEKLKEDLINALLKEAIGMTKDELEDYLTSPDKYFDTVMTNGAGEHVTLAQMNNYLALTDTGFNNPSEKLDYREVPAVYNTVTMSKLLLLNRSEINRLLSDLGSTQRLQADNVMLGFIPSLDGSRQWLNGMVIAQDDNAYCQVFMLQLGETPINCSPTAQQDSYIAAANPFVVSAANGVLANDTEPDGDPLTAILDTTELPRHGTVTLNADGSFSYAHNGTPLDDSFRYTVSDGAATSAPVWVTIEYGQGNDAPATRIDLYTVQENTVLHVPAAGVLANDYDSEGATVTAVIDRQPNHGTLDLAPDGGFTYTPDPFFAGFDSFYYIASDGQLQSGSTEVGLHVRANPNVIVANPDTYIALKNRTLDVPAPGLLANDSDRDGQPLTADEPSTSQIVGGFVTIRSDGSFTFAPATDYFGDGAFAYLATDGRAESAVSTTKIIIQETNGPPVAVDDRYLTAGDAGVMVNAPGVLSNDWDSDYHPEYAAYGLPVEDPQSADLVTAPEAGTVVLSADGSFSYSPGTGFLGRDRFSYKSRDAWDESNVATVEIVDPAANQLPVAVDDSYQAAAGRQLRQDAPGVLANDTDGDGDPLLTWVSVAPQHGTLKLNGDGSFVYTPDPGFSGDDGFVYAVTDGIGATQTATVTISQLGAGGSTVYLPLVTAR